MKRMVLAVALLLVPALSFADDLDKYVELMRSDMRTNKTAVLTEYMHLSEADGAKFWPIQRDYENALAKLQDQRLTMIKDYAANFDSLTDKKAAEITKQAFKLADQRSALLKSTTSKVAKAVGPKVAARFAQVEGFMQALVDVKVRGQVPLPQ
jgi:hypothetical protein